MHPGPAVASQASFRRAGPGPAVRAGSRRAVRPGAPTRGAAAGLPSVPPARGRGRPPARARPRGGGPVRLRSAQPPGAAISRLSNCAVNSIGEGRGTPVRPRQQRGGGRSGAAIGLETPRVGNIAALRDGSAARPCAQGALRASRTVYTQRARKRLPGRDQC